MCGPDGRDRCDCRREEARGDERLEKDGDDNAGAGDVPEEHGHQPAQGKDHAERSLRAKPVVRPSADKDHGDAGDSGKGYIRVCQAAADIVLVHQVQGKHCVDAQGHADAQAEQDEHDPERRIPHDDSQRGETRRLAAECAALAEAEKCAPHDQGKQADQEKHPAPGKDDQEQLRQQRRGDETRVGRKLVDGNGLAPVAGRDERGDGGEPGGEVDAGRQPDQEKS